MTIGVLWWSGRTWLHLIREALARRYTVKTLVRSPHKIPKDIAPDITTIQWDATDPIDITKILVDVDILIHTVSVWFFHKHPTTLYSRVTTAVISARETCDHTCKRYVVMSSFGTHHGRRLARPWRWWYERFLWDVADDKEREEVLLASSSLPWIIIKAVLLNNRSDISYTTIPFDEFVPTVRARVSRRAVACAILDLWTTLPPKKKIVVKAP